jgi:hypothetical protein
MLQYAPTQGAVTAAVVVAQTYESIIAERLAVREKHKLMYQDLLKLADELNEFVAAHNIRMFTQVRKGWWLWEHYESTTYIPHWVVDLHDDGTATLSYSDLGSRRADWYSTSIYDSIDHIRDCAKRCLAREQIL